MKINCLSAYNKKDKHSAVGMTPKDATRNNNQFSSESNQI